MTFNNKDICCPIFGITVTGSSISAKLTVVYTELLRDIPPLAAVRRRDALKPVLGHQETK